MIRSLIPRKRAAFAMFPFVDFRASIMSSRSMLSIASGSVEWSWVFVDSADCKVGGR